MLTTEGTMAFVDRRIAECTADVRLLARLELGAHEQVRTAWDEDDGGRHAETVAILLGLAESREAYAFEQREVSPERVRMRQVRQFAHYSFLMHEVLRIPRRWERSC